MKSIRPSKLVAVLIGIGCAAPTAQVLAQALLEEVVVTARRYEESITDAPVAVAVMSDEFLRENRVDTIQDILELTPGANWGQFAKAQPSLALRGLNGAAFGNASLEHSVSVVMDGVPVTKAFMITVPVYDVQRVEVLRGPQGTSFGRNATLGLMNFITARPSQEFSSNIDITAGSLDLGGVSGHVNGSLGENISGRLAFHRQYTGGSVEDENTGELIEYFDNTSLRGSLLIEPSDNLTAFIKAEIITDEEYPTTRTGKVEGAPWLNAVHGNYSVPEDTWQGSLAPPLGDPWIVERDMQFLTAELVWDLDNDRAVTWISGYQTGDHYSNSAAFGTPYNLREQAVWNDGNVFSQEVRIDNQASADRLRWVAGAFYQTDEGASHREKRDASGTWSMHRGRPARLLEELHTLHRRGEREHRHRVVWRDQLRPQRVVDTGCRRALFHRCPRPRFRHLWLRCRRWTGRYRSGQSRPEPRLQTAGVPVLEELGRHDSNPMWNRSEPGRFRWTQE